MMILPTQTEDSYRIRCFLQGVSQDAARQQIRLFDTNGLVVAGRPGLPDSKRRYAHNLPPSKPFNHLDLSTEYPQILAAIEDFKPRSLRISNS
jgi:hypothetical protein